MRKTDIEGWVLAVAERLTMGQPVEDDRVEIKAMWPTDIPKTARQIAGHANAARGEPILWIVGLNETNQNAVGAQLTEAADWLAGIRSKFDAQLSPYCETLAVPFKGLTLVGLLFETDRAPFVVTNPAGGAVSREVPWREANSTRSATREDLLRLLIPISGNPSLEVLGATLVAQQALDATWLKAELELYAVCRSVEPAIIPFHRCGARAALAGNEVCEFDRVQVHPKREVRSKPGLVGRQFQSRSLTVESSETEAIISGAGFLVLTGIASTKRSIEDIASEVSVTARIRGVHAERDVVLDAQLDFLSREIKNGQPEGTWATR